MNAWNCNQLGAGGGYPSGAVNLPGAGTAITKPSAISAWQASAHTMNSWGQAYQTEQRRRRPRRQRRTARASSRDGAHRRAGLRALLPPLPLRAGQVDPEHGHEVRQPLHLRRRLHRARLRRRVRAVGPLLAAGRPVDGRRRPERRPPGRRRPEPGPGQEPAGAAGPDGALAGPRLHVPRQGPRPDRSGHAGRQRRRQQRPGRGRRTRTARCRGHDSARTRSRSRRSSSASATRSATSTSSSATA